MKNSLAKEKSRREDSLKRGLTTISPPSKVNFDHSSEPKVMASGVDSLNLSLSVRWKNSHFHQFLEINKKTTQETGHSFPFYYDIPEMDDQLIFTTSPNGSKGYNWLITGTQYSLKFGKALSPNSRPNIFIEIRSEMLWASGIKNSIKTITLFLEKVGAKIVTIKPSRIDLCMDILVPCEMWNLELFDNKVSRARRFAHYTKNKKLTGVHIGKGKMSGRIYDKGEEIETISHKTWMYNVWGISSIPQDSKIIRIEFQLLREPLKDLGIDSLEDCINTLENIWAYCTQKWLKFQTNPGKHHTQRKMLPWWLLVQNNYLGIPEPVPAIRAKAIRTTQFQLATQIVGLIIALASVDDEFGNTPLLDKISQEGLVKVFRKALRIAGKNKIELRDAVNRKRAKNYRGKAKYQEANYNRLAAGLPSDMLTLGLEDDMTWVVHDMGVIK